MVAFMRKDMKWTHRELHDAVLVAAIAVPPVPSMRHYLAALYTQYGDADTGFLPQSFHTHTKNQAARHPAHLESHWCEIGWEAAREEGSAGRAPCALAQPGARNRPRGVARCLCTIQMVVRSWGFRS